MMFKPMPVLSVFSVASLIILVLLGNWQYARYAQKTAKPSIVEQVETRVLLEMVIDQTNPGNVQQVYGFANSEPLWRRYVPGRIVSSAEPVLIMAEATGGAAPISAQISSFPESVRFEGIVSQKVANRSNFSAQNEPDADIWYTFDPERIAARLGLPESVRVAEPVVMTVRNGANLAQSRQTLNPYAFAKPLDPLPAERHFGYALTWWGMALGLVGVYLALHHSRGRLKFKKA